MMNRRTFLCGLTLGTLAAPLTAGAQPGKVPRVGVLWRSLAQAAAPGSGAEAFYHGLRDLGWVEGQNIAIERRYAEERFERFPSLAAELVRLKVDVILPGAGPASLKAAREATKTIPIVMVASSSDPVGQGLAASLARPGGNITGITSAPAEVAGKRLDLLKEAVPGLSRTGVLWDTHLGPIIFTKEFAAAARLLALEVRIFEVSGPADYDTAVSAATKEGIRGLYVVGSPPFFRDRQQIADVLTKHRLPAISEWREFAAAGLLMTYGSSLLGEFRRAAYFVDKILKGASPSELPIEYPTKFELVINLKTAKALGLTIPPSLLLRADEVIE